MTIAWIAGSVQRMTITRALLALTIAGWSCTAGDSPPSDASSVLPQPDSQYSPTPTDSSSAAAIVARKKERARARGDEKTLTTITSLEQQAYARKGAGGPGPRQEYGRLAAGATRSLNIDFLGRTDAVVYVASDGDSPVDLAVYDPGGTRVAFDPGVHDESIIKWRPARKMSFRVSIRNRGANETGYVLLTN